jgi:hypothetical protein
MPRTCAPHARTKGTVDFTSFVSRHSYYPQKRACKNVLLSNSPLTSSIDCRLKVFAVDCSDVSKILNGIISSANNETYIPVHSAHRRLSRQRSQIRPNVSGSQSGDLRPNDAFVDANVPESGRQLGITKGLRTCTRSEGWRFAPVHLECLRRSPYRIGRLAAGQVLCCRDDS